MHVQYLYDCIMGYSWPNQIEQEKKKENEIEMK